MIYILLIRKRETVSYLQYVYDLDCVYQKEENCFIPTLYLSFRFCVSERGKLYHPYSMFMIYILCIRKRGTVSYLQYVYELDFVHQKEETVSYLQYVYNLDFVYKKMENYHSYSIFSISILCIRKSEAISCLQYIYVLDFVY